MDFVILKINKGHSHLEIVEAYRMGRDKELKKLDIDPVPQCLIHKYCQERAGLPGVQTHL
jgi:hypothetical protein